MKVKLPYNLPYGVDIPMASVITGGILFIIEEIKDKLKDNKAFHNFYHSSQTNPDDDFIPFNKHKMFNIKENLDFKWGNIDQNIINKKNKLKGAKNTLLENLGVKRVRSENKDYNEEEKLNKKPNKNQSLSINKSSKKHNLTLNQSIHNYNIQVQDLNNSVTIDVQDIDRGNSFVNDSLNQGFIQSLNESFGSKRINLSLNDIKQVKTIQNLNNTGKTLSIAKENYEKKVQNYFKLNQNLNMQNKLLSIKNENLIKDLKTMSTNTNNDNLSEKFQSIINAKIELENKLILVDAQYKILEANKTKLDKKIEEYNKSFTDQNNTILSLKNQINLIQKENENLKLNQDLESEKITNEYQKLDLDNKKKLKELQEINDKKKASLLDYKNQINLTKTNFTNEINEKINTINELKEQIDQVEKTCNELRKAQELEKEYSQKITKKQKQINNDEKIYLNTFTILKAQLNDEIKLKSDLERKINEIGIEYTNYSQEMKDNNEKTILDYENKIQNLTNQYNNLIIEKQKQIDDNNIDYTNNINNLNNELSSERNLGGNLIAQIDNLNGQLINSQQEKIEQEKLLLLQNNIIQNLSNQIDNLTAELNIDAIDKLKTELNDQINIKNGMSFQIDNLNANNLNYSQQIIDKEKLLLLQNNTIQNLTNQIDNLTAEKQNYSQNTDNLRAQLDAQSNLKNEITANLNSLKNEYTFKLNQMKNNLNIQQDLYDTLVQKSNTQILKLENDNKNTQLEYDKAIALIKERDLNLVNYEKKIEKLNADYGEELTRKNDKIANLKQSLQEAEQSNLLYQEQQSNLQVDTSIINDLNNTINQLKEVETNLQNKISNLNEEKENLNTLYIEKLREYENAIEQARAYNDTSDMKNQQLVNENINHINTIKEYENAIEQMKNNQNAFYIKANEEYQQLENEMMLIKNTINERENSIIELKTESTAQKQMISELDYEKEMLENAVKARDLHVRPIGSANLSEVNPNFYDKWNQYKPAKKIMLGKKKPSRADNLIIQIDELSPKFNKTTLKYYSVATLFFDYFSQAQKIITLTANTLENMSLTLMDEGNLTNMLISCLYYAIDPSFINLDFLKINENDNELIKLLKTKFDTKNAIKLNTVKSYVSDMKTHDSNSLHKNLFTNLINNLESLQRLFRDLKVDNWLPNFINSVNEKYLTNNEYDIIFDASCKSYLTFYFDNATKDEYSIAENYTNVDSALKQQFSYLNDYLEIMRYGDDASFVNNMLALFYFKLTNKVDLAIDPGIKKVGLNKKINLDKILNKNLCFDGFDFHDYIKTKDFYFYTMGALIPFKNDIQEASPNSIAHHMIPYIYDDQVNFSVQPLALMKKTNSFKLLVDEGKLYSPLEFFLAFNYDLIGNNVIDRSPFFIPKENMSRHLIENFYINANPKEMTKFGQGFKLNNKLLVVSIDLQNYFKEKKKNLDFIMRMLVSSNSIPRYSIRSVIMVTRPNTYITIFKYNGRIIKQENNEEGEICFDIIGKTYDDWSYALTSDLTGIPILAFFSFE